MNLRQSGGGPTPVLRHTPALGARHLNNDADGINQGTARVLYAIYTGDILGRDTRGDHHVRLGASKNRNGIHIGHGDGSRYTLTDDATFAFDVW